MGKKTGSNGVVRRGKRWLGNLRSTLPIYDANKPTVNDETLPVLLSFSSREIRLSFKKFSARETKWRAVR
jgi:hypothetical protein